ncbi:MAG: TIGR04283 family arsenosugar biosynthesis glycosyltransferase [Chitinophagaceae bacterium]|nr:TIGR04283 family arsenosugar biosynthesis glycosyltransferase [Chitinophagaceae bacterium]
MISVIIPTYNEGQTIKTTIQRIKENDFLNLVSEILIVDGGSNDNTFSEALTESILPVLSPQKGRAAQMNYGASISTNEIIYFLHADTIPPSNFSKEIIDSIHDGNEAGCFTLKFDFNHWFLKANCWFTKLDINAFRFGDQSLFVSKKIYLKVGGFCENHIIMEDQDFIKKIKKVAKFSILNKPVTTSARKYLENGIYKTQAIFFLIFFMYKLGFSQPKLVSIYRKFLSQHKI